MKTGLLIFDDSDDPFTLKIERAVTGAKNAHRPPAWSTQTHPKPPMARS